MKNLPNTLLITTATIFALLALVPDSFAQEEKGIAEQAAKDTSDKSGTNPINFQRDLRIYNEYLWLNTAGDERPVRAAHTIDNMRT